ncbi:MAG TPA: hypothetical protein VFT29_05505 [Gemmatimonadaceae bacterium]|nr:hypothetical protein [Gemmatimonadaceae bacterium]
MRFVRTIGCAALCVTLAGCYTLTPARGVAPVPGERLAFDVNDAGRVALGPSMGAEIMQIEGRLIERTSDDYHVAVLAVRTLRGGEQVWTGERVHIKPEYVSTVYERKFSRGRTIAATAITVGSFATLVGISAVAGILTDDGRTDNKPTPEGFTRRP